MTDKQTDGWTDILSWHSPRYAYASCGKDGARIVSKTGKTLVVRSGERDSEAIRQQLRKNTTESNLKQKFNCKRAELKQVVIDEKHKCWKDFTSTSDARTKLASATFVLALEVWRLLHTMDRGVK